MKPEILARDIVPLVHLMITRYQQRTFIGGHIYVSKIDVDDYDMWCDPHWDMQEVWAKLTQDAERQHWVAQGSLTYHVHVTGEGWRKDDMLDGWVYRFRATIDGVLYTDQYWVTSFEAANSRGNPYPPRDELYKHCYTRIIRAHAARRLGEV